MGSLGVLYGPEPSGTPLKRVLGSDARNPGLMTMHYYTDPNDGSYAVESPDGQNVVLASGQNLSYQNGGAFYGLDSQKSFPYPKVANAGAPYASGHDGTLYPYQYGA